MGSQTSPGLRPVVGSAPRKQIDEDERQWSFHSNAVCSNTRALSPLYVTATSVAPAGRGARSVVVSPGPTGMAPPPVPLISTVSVAGAVPPFRTVVTIDVRPFGRRA